MRHLIPVFFIIFTIYSSFAQIEEKKFDPMVKHVGAMKNVMKKGELQGTIALDTLQPKTHLFGIGPLENLQGEITVFEGENYVSQVASDSTMTVSTTFGVKAPFFVYANVTDWKEIKLPKSVIDLETLEIFLNKLMKTSEHPVAFKIEATVVEATIHIVNLPMGTKVSSPEEAHQGLVQFKLSNQSVDLIGFYSTKHHAVFTHHDTNMHIHLVSKDRKQSGHLEKLLFKKGSIKIYLPTT